MKAKRKAKMSSKEINFDVLIRRIAGGGVGGGGVRVGFD
jgi:hypothetical protein